jgi:leader peptidase (prepilin peptidase)/N-methyltransferase
MGWMALSALVLAGGVSCGLVGGSLAAITAARATSERVADGRVGAWAPGWGRDGGIAHTAVGAICGAVVCTTLVLRLGLSAPAAVGSLILLVMVAASAVDIAVGQIPREMVYIGVAIGAAGMASIAIADGDYRAALDALGGGAACTAAFGLLWALSPRSIGMGDVRLVGLLGLTLGWYGPFTVGFGLWAAFIAAGLAGGPLFLIRGRRSRFPFAPALTVGTLAGLLVGACVRC